MGLVCRMECLFSSQLVPVPIYTAWWTCRSVIWNEAEATERKQWCRWAIT